MKLASKVTLYLNQDVVWARQARIYAVNTFNTTN